MVDERRFTLHGRADRIVKIEEKRISLDLIESRLVQSGLVAEARTLVVAGSRSRIAAFVVLSDAGRKALAEGGKLALNLRLRDWLADTVERVALPRSWRYPDALPVNAQGKTTQSALMALLDDPGTHKRRTTDMAAPATGRANAAAGRVCTGSAAGAGLL